MNKAKQLDKVVSGFLAKANKKNEPLEAFRETESFKQFESKLEKAIQKQAKWTAANLDLIDYLENEEMTDSQFEANFGHWLKNNMPKITEYVSAEKVAIYLQNAFSFSVEAQYARMNISMKKSTAPYVDFNLTNPYYIAALKDQANYLLNRSSVDETTRKRLIKIVRDNRLAMESLDQLAKQIMDETDINSPVRAFMIANTETNQAMSTAQDAFLKENGIKSKRWIPAGANTCEICDGNAAQGAIPVDDSFESGDPHPPGHVGCECYEDAGEEIDLDTIPVLWDGRDTVMSKQWSKDQADKLKRSERESEMFETLSKQAEGRKQELSQAIEKSAESLTEQMLKLKAEMKDASVQDIQKLADKLSKELKPEHKTVIQKAELPTEIVEIIKMLSVLVALPEKPDKLELDDFVAHDQEEGATDYFGFVHPCGAWYIMEGVENKQRYAAGESGYVDAWEKKESLKYKMIYELEIFS